MSVFGGMFLTNKGRTLQTKAQTGVQLNFTRMAVGDGELGSSIIIDLNSLKNEIKSLDIIRLEVMTEGKAVVGSVLSNQDLDSGFYFREIGVFADDPDEGEILYCYGNAGENAEYITAGGGADVIEKVINIITIIGDAENVSASIDESLAYVTIPVFNEHLSDDSNPHNVTHNQTGPAAVDETSTDATKNKHVSNNLAKGWQDHKNSINNPHGVTAAQIDAVNKNGDTMTGTLINDKGFVSIAQDANNNAHYWLQDSNGINRGSIVWDRLNGSIMLRQYDDEGVQESEIKLKSTSMFFNNNEVLHDGLNSVAYSKNKIGVDLNTIIQSGMYSIGDTNANRPPNVNWGQLLVMHGAEDTITQIVTDITSTSMYWRSGNPSETGGSGSWHAWRKIWHEGQAANSFANAGYQKLPSGLILQWGYISVGVGDVQGTITYPLTFPSGVFNVTISEKSIGSSDGRAVRTTNINSQSFELTRDTFGSARDSNFGVYWFAIGY